MAKALAVILLAFLLAVTVVTNVRAVSPYAPQKGDYFGYSETIAVNNGQGSYTGYTDQTKVTGMEQMDAMNGTTVSASYNYNFQFSNNQGSSTSSSSSGHYTWSSGTYTYLNGTDNQVGYSQPTYVWFVIDPSLPVGGTFYLLNTQFAILSKNYSLQVPNESGGYVLTIQGKGTGERQRNDDYGVFNVTYSWYAYFDPSTGYIVGYNYVEEDNGQYQGQAAGFTYTDDLYVTSTSYTLTPATSPATISTTGNVANLNAFEGLSPYLPLAFLFIIIVLIFAVTRARGKRDSLPKHSPYPSPPTPSPAPLKPSIDLGSKPPEQVVIREVAKVNCRYCGTLIPTTVDTCPYCGGSRR
ncbi:MAG TPA: hypothetical protein VEG61_04270 [Candidatus Dormibacteraeota bacterium]|nr:hypothetical protein [Candidatus Dormibacteraeota bacterium]